MRPSGWDFPLFLHVFGAMTLFGAALTAFLAAVAAWRSTDSAALRRAWRRTRARRPRAARERPRGGAQWIYSKEGFTGNDDPSWIGIGFGAADGGLVLLLVTIGVAYWWRRSARPLAGRIVTGLSAVYLLVLAIAWLAMSGKWG